VQSSAEYLGYRRPRKATAEQGKGGRLVGVLVPFFDEKSSFQRIRGIVSRLAPYGCEVVLHNIESPSQARAGWAVGWPYAATALLACSQLSDRALELEACKSSDRPKSVVACSAGGG
jgi:DNA-binding LacI/PurR family transcriptional regulator